MSRSVEQRLADAGRTVEQRLADAGRTVEQRLADLNIKPEEMLAKAEAGGINLTYLIDWYEKYDEARIRHNKLAHVDNHIGTGAEDAFNHIRYLESVLKTLLGTGNWRAGYRGWMSDENRKSIKEYRQCQNQQ